MISPVTPVTATPTSRPRIVLASPPHLATPPLIRPETDDLPLGQRLSLCGQPALIAEVCDQDSRLSRLEARIDQLEAQNGRLLRQLAALRSAPPTAGPGATGRPEITGDPGNGHTAG